MSLDFSQLAEQLNPSSVKSAKKKHSQPGREGEKEREERTGRRHSASVSRRQCQHLVIMESLQQELTKVAGDKRRRSQLRSVLNL